MEISLELCLPREAASVPVARQMLDSSLNVLGVERAIRSDIQIMLSEACTNVIRHAEDSDEYSVTVEISDGSCLMKVLDRGHGFDAETGGDLDVNSESGRGVMLMEALADRLDFAATPGDGTLVTLEKRLHFDNGAGELLAHPPM